ncbi:MAG: hypothetical protein NUV80_01190 [Candidatus Berkelbacteria bacterium]|nr:hypothetical protein [Candidatus Berkelbacteria bacterium]
MKPTCMLRWIERPIDPDQTSETEICLQQWWETESKREGLTEVSEWRDVPMESLREDMKDFITKAAKG